MQESGMRLAERIMLFVLEFTCVHGEGGFVHGQWVVAAGGEREEEGVSVNVQRCILGDLGGLKDRGRSA